MGGFALYEWNFYRSYEPPPCDCEKPLDSLYTNLSLPPIATFEDKCASCHGAEGSMYPAGFAQKETMTMLNLVRGMMEDQVYLHPNEQEVAAMTTYHLAMKNQQPFICITEVAFNDETQYMRLQGETQPGNRLLWFNGETLMKEVIPDTSGNWKLEGVFEAGMSLEASKEFCR